MSCQLAACGFQALAFSDVGNHRRVTERSDQPLQCLQGASAADAISTEAHIHLEVGECCCGERTPDPVDATDGEAQSAEHPLDFGDVIAAKVRRAQVQQAVA